jgi:hypothetical protein
MLNREFEIPIGRYGNAMRRKVRDNELSIDLFINIE